MMERDDLFDISQTKSKTFDIVHIATGHAIEFLKNTSLGLFAHTHPMIFDGADELTSDILCSDDDIRGVT